jgi:RNA polymerase sigma factor (sigma-70 family)
VSEPTGGPHAAEVERPLSERATRPNGWFNRAHTSRMAGSRTNPSAVGPTDDFESFFRREHPRLLAIAVAIVGDREVARELVQDALLKAFSSWSKIAILDSPGGWTRRVLINLSIDVHRRHRRERGALTRLQASSTVEAPSLPTPALWSAVHDLPRLQRAVVALYYVDDMPIADVAIVLGVSPGTVKTSLSRARGVLAPTLSGQLQWEVES